MRATPSSAAAHVALVTGGAVRLGRAVALALARQGWDLAIAYGASASDARTARKEARASGRRVHAVQADLGDPSACVRVVDAVRKAFGRLDLLVNSASTFEAADLLDVTASDWDEVMAVNLRAPFLLARDAAPMLQASGGQIVNVVDLSAFEPWTGRPHHAVSKAGLAHLTKIMARAFAPRVRVNAIAPGVVLPPEDYEPAELKALRRRVPLGRIGSPQDVIDALRFLTEADYVTGETIVVDGGMSL